MQYDESKVQALIQAGRCALADLQGCFENGGQDEKPLCETITELYVALQDLGEDVSAYDDIYQDASEFLTADDE